MKRHIPSIELLDAAYRDKDWVKIRRLSNELHAIAASLAAASDIPHKPKVMNDFTDPDPTIQPDDIPPVYAITYGGKLWQWNCGWREFDPVKRKHIGPTLGHLAFRRKPLCHQKQKDWVYLPRPYGPWRRIVVTRMALTTPPFHNVEVLCTDGIKAIVKFDDGSTTDVFYSNLREISTPMVSKLKKLEAESRAPKVPKKVTITKKSLLELL